MMEDIRDIRVPVEIPYFWILLGVLLCALAAGIYIFYSRKKKSEVPVVIVPRRPAWEIANERLTTLAGKNYPAKGMFKTFYGELSDIVRHYLEDQFHIRAPEMTTEEFLNHMKITAVLKTEHKEILKDFLNGCDMVKFAKFEPGINDAQANFDLVKKLIVESKN